MICAADPSFWMSIQWLSTSLRYADRHNSQVPVMPICRCMSFAVAMSRVEPRHIGLGARMLRAQRPRKASRGRMVRAFRRGHYELGVDIDPRRRLVVIFAELAPHVLETHWKIASAES